MRRLLKRAPWLISAFRLYQRTRLDRFIYPIVRGPNLQSARARAMTQGHMRRHVSDPALREALTPDYAIGCKRMLISDDFYTALGSGAVKLVASAASRFEPDAVIAADGTRAPADIAVHATGFDLGAHYRSLDVRGPGGLKLKDLWATRAEGYLGSAVAGFPNFWQVGGPNTLVGTTSVVHMHEMQADWIVRAIRLAGDGLIAPKKRLQDAWNARVQSELASTVWATGGCSSWYKRPDGFIETLYSGKAADYRRDLARCEADQFERFDRPAEAARVAAHTRETAA
jgi:cation diffusion facilitator CzcD-associated flavoprotein CzcO